LIAGKKKKRDRPTLYF